MRFKKGSTVEVLSKKEVPSGSWRCGKIVSGNGHYYSVMYNSLDGNREETIMERVSRKSIRPCPPLVQGIKNWVPGDVVEVLDSNSWKIATISKVIDENYFLVRLLGSSHQFRVHSYNLRVRQSWQDDKWFVVGKGSGNCEDGRFNKPSTSKCHHKLSTEVLQKDSGTEPFVGDDCLRVGNNIGFQESHMVSSRTLKRGSSYCSPHIEAFTGSAGKVRIIEKRGRHQQMVPGRSSPLLKKGQSWRLVHLASKGLKLMASSEPLIYVMTDGTSNTGSFCEMSSYIDALKHIEALKFAALCHYIVDYCMRHF